MGLLDWMKGGKKTLPSTAPIERGGILDFEAPRPGIEDDFRLFATDEEAKAAIRKACRCIDYMIDGIRFSRLETRDEKYEYEIYKSPSRQTALRFLRSVPSHRIPTLYYVIVETPTGNIGRDIRGLFDESKGEEISASE